MAVYILSLLFLSYSSFASTPASKEANLVFDGAKVVLEISAAESSTKTEFVNVKTNSGKQELEFKTPQYAAEPVTNIPVTLFKNFAGLRTLKMDIKAVGGGSTPVREKLKGGDLYYWTTLTAGSSTYFYLQCPSNKAVAIKIGPLAGTVAKDVNFNWSKARWIK